MKKNILVLLIVFSTSCLYGQMLEPQEGTNQKWGFIDNTGNLVIPYKYDRADGFIEGLAAVSINGKWGFIDKNDSIVIPFKYTYIDGFSTTGFAMVNIDDKYGFIDRKGTEVVPLEYTKEEAIQKFKLLNK